MSLSIPAHGLCVGYVRVHGRAEVTSNGQREGHRHGEFRCCPASKHQNWARNLGFSIPTLLTLRLRGTLGNIWLSVEQNPWYVVLVEGKRWAATGAG